MRKVLECEGRVPDVDRVSKGQGRIANLGEGNSTEKKQCRVDDMTY